MKWKFVIAKPAAKFLKKLRDAALREQLMKAIRALTEDPRPPGCLKLQGESNFYRVRVGDYRILYAIEDQVMTILVVEIGNRKDIYR